MAQLLTALLASAALLAGARAQAPEAAAPEATEADYVVVGGGTAGCALAARLCEGLPDTSVVLLERATPRTPAQVHCPTIAVAVCQTPAVSRWYWPSSARRRAREWHTISNLVYMPCRRMSFGHSDSCCPTLWTLKS